ncbi:NAD-dependent epimerase [Brevibacillus reuszeri]|uniref:NAD-dependent epimerase n=1 Tax=Brevibacillus reuszeri TaxID=54915 RepID=A0A0K9YIU9_9BACL|nr:NAD-dependent epimerase/dehydratase family protein [Brevibacillus reuszeri]KNB68617.1 NAD-dependent epimerase [Brevibacillus reuszeri]MED1858903.1 NAD-dependent epimerase/dehydratase family protein [Brevibacillus reuszeri]GED69117.1 NAD-dependent epimerase [Brevibacillus reuszeri]
MAVVIVTGSAGLIGSETAAFYAESGYQVVGIDNNMRQTFFGAEGSTLWNRSRLIESYRSNYEHYDADIRNANELEPIFARYGQEIVLIVHTAAQPSHDWAAKDPITDFAVNANGTLHLLEATRKYCPGAVFVFTSTNKVYGDAPNRLPLIEKETRWEIDPAHPYQNGIKEDLSVDQNMHSLFGASKLAADILVQEYGRYFGIRTVCFRGGVLSGSRQAGVPLHGFINYLMKCAMTGTPYTIFGYKGKQVRDVIHAHDVVRAIHAVYTHPPAPGEVYNLGGGIYSNISVLEAIHMVEDETGRAINFGYSDQHRSGDHIWYVSSLEKFMQHYPNWSMQYSMKMILEEIYQENKERWSVTP